MFRSSLVAIVLAFLAMVAGGAGASTPYKFVEEFASSQYKDTATTTADWDTAAGTAHLNVFTPGPVGALATFGQALGVAIDGTHVFLADNSALRIIDVSDGSAPTLTGTVAIPGTARGVDVAGDYAYVAAGDSGIAVVDISNRAAPSLVTHVTTAGSALRVAVAGDYAYVAANTADFQVIDISDPTAPSLVTGLSIAGSGQDVAVQGNYAYLATGSIGVQIIDISDPTAPAALGNYGTGVVAVEVAGDYAYLASAAAGLLVVDVSDPMSPSLAGSYVTGNTRDVAVDGNLVFVSDASNSVYEFDVSNPASPALEGTYATVAYPRALAYAAGTVYVAVDSQGLQVLQTHTWIRPEILADRSFTTATANDVAVSGNRLVLLGLTEFELWDITDPGDPVFRDSEGLVYFGFGSDAVIDGDVLYVIVYQDGLRVYDISTPSAIVEIDNEPGTEFQSVAVDGDRLFVLGLDSRLDIFDATRPDSLVLLGEYFDPVGGGKGIAVHGNVVFAAMGPELEAIDASDPTAPSLLGSVSIPNYVTDIEVAGDYLFAQTQYNFNTIDITDPAAPSLVATISRPGRDLAIVGNTAFVTTFSTTSEGQLAILDISDPLAPATVDLAQLPAHTKAIAAQGEHLFASYMVSGGNDGFYTLQALSRHFSYGNVVASTVIPLASPYVQIRAGAASSGTVDWDVYIYEEAGPGNPFPQWVWTPVPADSTWQDFSADILRWRGDLVYDPSQPAVSPVADRVEFEVRYAHAVIDSIADVPGDQGGAARLYMTRAGADWWTAQYPVTDYVVWRRLDASTASAPAGEATPKLPERLRGLTSAAVDLPPGNWEIITSFPAMSEEQYTVLVPTLGDSTASGPVYTVFAVSAHVGFSSMVSPPDSGYSVDNIAPGVPQSFAVAYNAPGGTELSWDASPEPDFQYYRVYRSTDPGFTPTSSDLVYETASPGWTDPVADAYQYAYKVTALDHAGNESDPAGAGTVTSAGDGAPLANRLEQNVPNPFNPSTTIAFTLREAGEVTLAVYDATGRHVRTLVSGRREARSYDVAWDGRDDAGTRVASGVYFYRLTAGSFTQTRKMVLLK